MKKPTQKEMEIIDKVKLDYDKPEMFLHCKDCMSKFLESADYKSGLMSPKDWGQYQGSTYPFTYPDRSTANIFVVWCNRCEKSIWDSRHLTHLY